MGEAWARHGRGTDEEFADKPANTIAWVAPTAVALQRRRRRMRDERGAGEEHMADGNG